jgi:hypothetical protein
MSKPPADSSVNQREGWWTRDNALIVVLVTATALLLVACCFLVQPFMAKDGRVGRVVTELD